MLKLRAAATFTLLATALLSSGPARAGTANLDVTWNKEGTSVRFFFRGQQVEYPAALGEGAFPAPGEPVAFDMLEDWPVATMKARWSMDARNWPASFKAQMLGLILVLVANADEYAGMFPNSIISSKFTSPPQYLTDGRDPATYDLAAFMRGKHFLYECLCKAGFGAADYTIKTRIKVGLSQDGQTLFYQDDPSYIGDHLAARLLFFAVRADGPILRFELRTVAVCADRMFFRGEALRRVTADCRYFVEQLYARLSRVPRMEEVENWLSRMRAAQTQYRAK